ncbi:MAG TPA: hypothetical protein VK823_13530 [Streptosporangiaceae bacterium]|jgi:hypothetical protein|nr:hypothetical protein [Streptosporangiaceae bacterium]
MTALAHLIEGWWWLVFIFGGTVSGSVRQALRHHHKRRLAIIAAKAELAETKNAAMRPAPDPQPVCGCSHHLSFHSPSTSACAVDDCRCQQYIGPEPLGHVVALPLVDPERLAMPPEPAAEPRRLGSEPA